MSTLKKLKTDPVKENDGVWIDFPDVEGVSFCLARFGNTDFQDAIRRLRGEGKAKKAFDKLPEAETKKLMAPLVAEFIVLGWVGLTDEKNDEIPWSVAKATELLLDPELHDLYNWIVKESSDVQNFRHEVQETQLGNSVKSSSGT